MAADYSSTPLSRKIGYKTGYKVMTRHEPTVYFDLLMDLPEELQWYEDAEDESLDLIHAFYTDQRTLLRELVGLKCKIKKTGMVWLSWPKASSELATDLKSAQVRTAGLDAGLVDVKVCSIDKDWSAMKFMYRKTDR